MFATRSTECISLNPNYISVYTKFLEKKRSSLSGYINFINSDNAGVTPAFSLDNKHNGFISVAAARRMGKAIDWLLFISAPKEAWNYFTKSKFKFRLNFLTLTLPCKQFHSDVFIKSKMLNNFLTVIRQRYKVSHYIWRAEKQLNGNIHFHLILNEFIHHSDVRNIWNKILDNYGYIEKYRENKKAFYGGRFRVNSAILNRYTVSQQRKLYKKNVSENWSNPNSTDIHSVSNVRNLRSYAAKYLSKNFDVKKSIKFLKKNEETEEQCEKRLTLLLAVTGRLWFISQELSKCKNIPSFICNDIADDLKKIFAKLKNKIIRNDFCTILPIKITDLPKINCNKLFEYFCSKLKEVVPSFSVSNLLLNN